MVAYITINSVYEFPVSAFSSEFLYFVFLVTVILIGVRQNLSLFFPCFSLVAKDVEHIFTYLVGICIFLLKSVFSVIWPIYILHYLSL
jgi:hypothetical protein